jgi:RimJ/RimL family protein N-acetyltransferase
VLIIRKSLLEDCRALFDIRNHESIRLMSLNSAELVYEEHAAWFMKILNLPTARHYTLLWNETIIGAMRYDLQTDSEATASIYIGPEFWGKGLATQALSDTEKLFRLEFPAINLINAFVRAENNGSKKLFEKSGYIIDVHHYKKRF